MFLQATFEDRLRDVEVGENETGMFTVVVSDESAEVKWYKDSEEVVVSVDERIRFVRDEKVRQLVIRSVSVHDEGEYTCALVDDDVECSAELVVVGEGRLPNILLFC
jgi:hypothetical protein